MPALTCRSLSLTPVSVPLEKPVRTASGVVTHSPLVLIDLTTDQGVAGRSYLFTYTPLVLKAVHSLLAELTPALVGHSIAPVELERSFAAKFRLLGTSGLLGMALAGIDMAAWDALSRAASMPLAQYLGGSTKPVRAYFSQGMDGIDEGVKLAQECVARGFEAMKIKIGYPTLAEDIEVITEVSRALGPSVQLAVDYNQSLTRAEAIRRCLAIDELGLMWIEEPVLQEDYAGAASIADRLRTPIQRGENWFGSTEMALSLEAGGSNIAMLDVMKIGGVSGWLRAAAIAHEHRTPVSSHIFHEISSHLLAATSLGGWVEYLPIAEAILETPVRLEQGKIVLNTTPGSGLDWSQTAVKRYAV
jgi:mandelate racemase